MGRIPLWIMWIALLTIFLGGAIAFAILGLSLHPEHAGARTEYAAWLATVLLALASAFCAKMIWCDHKAEQQRKAEEKAHKRSLISFPREWRATRDVNNNQFLLTTPFKALGNYAYFSHKVAVAYKGKPIPIELQQDGGPMIDTKGLTPLFYTADLALIPDGAELDVALWVQMGPDQDVTATESRLITVKTPAYT